jgi:hypothetical protein
MRVYSGTYNGTVWRAYSCVPPTQVICELYEDHRDGREYQRWQGYLETYWATAGLYRLGLILGACILELDDGSRGLIYTTYWRGGYAGARWAQFLGPGPTGFQKGRLAGQIDRHS